VLIVIRSSTQQVVASATNIGAPAQTYTVKRGATPSVGVLYVADDGTPDPYPDGAGITVGFKLPNPNNTIVPGTTAFDGAYTVAGSTGANPDDNGIYWIAVGFEGAALNTALGFDPPDVNNDVVQVTLAGEVMAVNGSEVDKSGTFSLIVQHDINTGAEGAVTAAAYLYPQIWGTIAALTGGGATDLDDQATAGVQTPPNMIAMTGVTDTIAGGGALVNAGALTIWQLQPAAGRVTGAGLVQPLDFNAVTNDVIWVKVL
jgi:hypothetical protein